MVLHSTEYCNNRVGRLIMEHVQACVEAVLAVISGGVHAGVSIVTATWTDFIASVADMAGDDEAIVKEVLEAAASSPLKEHLARGIPASNSSGSSRQRTLMAVLINLGARNELVCIVARQETEAHELCRLCHESGLVNAEQTAVWACGALPLASGILFVTENSMLFDDAMRSAVRACCAHLIWFSPRSVVHASGFDMDSSALTVSRQICGVQGGKETGPECHVIATRSQALHWIEISKADEQLLAASEFVSAGDASLEEGLLQLCNKGISSLSERLLPSPSSLLHTLCCGMCGVPPSFNVYATPGESWQAEVTLRCPETNGTSFVGRAVSPQEARDASAMQALAFLTTSGIVTTYWKTSALENTAKGGRTPEAEAHFLTADSSRVEVSPFTVGAPEFAANPVAERLICTVCGIATTSEAHLLEHQNGRRHQKNLERLQQQLGAAQGTRTHPPAGQFRDHGTDSMNFTRSGLANLPSSLSDVVRQTRETPLHGSDLWTLPSSISMNLSSIIDEINANGPLIGEPGAGREGQGG
jgi:hypothetical protein